MRVLAALLLAVLAVGCTGDPPTRPRPAEVEFDSVAIVKPDTTWVALYVSNSGGSTAYAARVYWHSGSGGAVQVSPDSIRWSAAP